MEGNRQILDIFRGDEIIQNGKMRRRFFQTPNKRVEVWGGVYRKGFFLKGFFIGRKELGG